YLDGRWDEAVDHANQLIAEPDSGDRHYSDPGVLSLRASIRLARGDTGGADSDSERAAELARGSDAQAQSQAFCVRAAVALAARNRDEAGEPASEPALIGPVVVAAPCPPLPTLVDVALVFRDLRRQRDFPAGVLDAAPHKG